MKKFLKKFSLVIIAFVFLFVFINEVKAADCAGLEGCRMTKNRRILIAGGAGEGNAKPIRSISSATSEDRYRAVNINYKTLGVNHYNTYAHENVFRDNYSAMFCIDPQHEGYTHLIARRFLLNPGNDLKVNSFDMAVLSVVTNSGTGYIVNPLASLAYEKEYFSRLLAVRTLILSYKYETGTGASIEYAKDFYAGFTVVDRWLKDPDVLDAYLKLSQALIASGDTGLRWEKSYAAYSNYNFTGAPVDLAKTYYLRALKEAYNFVKNGSGNSTVSHSIKAEDKEIEENSNGVLVKKDVVHTIKVKGIPKSDNSTFVINPLAFKDNKIYRGLTAKITKIQIGDYVTQDEAAVQALLGKNVFDISGTANFDFQNETEIKITVHFEGYQSSTDKNIQTLACSDASINYYIPITYSGNMFGKYSKYVATVWQSQTYVMNGYQQKVQRYIGIEDKGGEVEVDTTEFTSENEIYLIEECDCPKLQKACEESRVKNKFGRWVKDINSPECQEFFNSNCGPCYDLETKCEFGDENACEEKAKVCEPVCNASFSGNANCCDSSDGTLIVTDSEDLSKDNIEYKIDAPDDVMGCFVNSVDNQCNKGTDGNSCTDIKGAEDDNENSYNLYDSNKNKYCQVSCTESFAMKMPAAKLVNAGRYFTFKATIEDTLVCYTNTIDREQYNKDMIKKQEELLAAYTEYSKWKALDEASIQSRQDSKSASNSCCLSSSSYECGTAEKPKTCHRCNSRCHASDSTNTWTEYYVNATYDESYIASYDEETGTVTIGTRSRSAGYDEDGHRDGSCSSGCCYAHCTNGSSGSNRTLANNIDRELANAKRELQEAQNGINDLADDFNSCSDWNKDIEYDTDNVSYDYQEDYLEKNSLTGEMKATVKKGDTKSWYCNSSVDETGKETNRAKLQGKNYDKCTIDNTKNYNEKNVDYLYCDTTGCKTKPVGVSTSRYKKYETKITVTYRPKTLFYNIYPSGEVIINGEDNPTATEITNGLPVSLKTQRGIYKYTVNVKNLGAFYENQNDSYGKYIGSDSAVVSKEGFVYACAYLVNIPTKEGWVCDFDDSCENDCISNCQGPGCSDSDKDFCDGVDCVSSCVGVGCIYDKDAGSSLLERVVSLNNLFPNGTDSYNWNADINTKALDTVLEIEEAGNTIYEEDPILSVTINPSMAKQIKEYNKQEENNGGYSNGTLDCYKLGNYEEAVCYSSFINDILDKKYGNDVVNDKSKIKDDKYRTRTDVEINANSNKDTYFKGWQDVSDNYMLGPSWK